MAAGGNNNRWAGYSRGRGLFCDRPFRWEPGMPRWTLVWKLALPNSCIEAAVSSAERLPDLAGGGSAPKEVSACSRGDKERA